jgi:hypothetical protein
MSAVVSPSGWRDSATRVRSASTATFPGRMTLRPTDRLVPRWWAEIGLVLGLYFAYVLTRGLQSARGVDAERTGWALLHWEQRWHLAVEAPLNAGLQNFPAIAVLCGYFYATLHFVVTPAVLVFLYRRQPAVYRQARTALALATAAALIGYFLLPTAPPRLLTGGGFQDSLAAVSSWGWWGGEGSAPRGLGGLTNQLAAMPSLHVGWALWSGWCIARYAQRRTARILGAAYPLLTTLVVISTGNHYLVDAVAGSLLIVLAWVVVACYRVARRPEPYVAVEAKAKIPAPRTAAPVRPSEPVTIPTQAARQPAEGGTGSRPRVCSSR